MSGRFEDAKGAAEEMAGRVERTAGEVVKSVSHTTAKVRDRAQDMMGDVDLDSARDAVERHTRANPLLAVLVASAVGLLIGRLILPRRS